MVKRLILFAAILLLIGACVSTPVPTVTLWAPTQTETFTATPTSTQTSTSTSTPTLVPTPTTTATLTATPEFMSPTPVSMGTSSIIEVTALVDGGYTAEGWQALPSDSYYIPANNLYIRSGLGTDYPSLGQIYAGRRVAVYAMHYWKYAGERWLCLDEPAVPVDKEFVCQKQVAYIVNSVQWGELILPSN